MVRSESLMPTPPSAIARPGASAFGSTNIAPPCGKPVRADAVKQRDRWDVERLLQGAARRDGTLEREVEVLRRIGAKTHRLVFDQGLRMGDAVFEGKAV